VPVFRCDIMTLYGRIYSGEAESLTLVTADGELQILAGHEPVAAPVMPCVLNLLTADGVRIAATSGGFVTVTQKKVELFLDSGEWAAEIDRKRAEEALARAEQRLKEGAMSWETNRARASAARARARLAALAAEAGRHASTT
jgi:F-type H+-transporting ATPase subunit epsilon